jgi:dolichol kinase
LLSGAPHLSNRKGSEGVRRTVHFLAGGCAFLLAPLGARWGAVIAAAALLYNAGLAPALGLDRSYRREGEGVWGGLTTYPLAVLLLIVLTPRLEIAAAAWAVLAAADPVAAAVGTRLPQPPVPFNRRKSLAGSAAGALAGTLASFAVLLWMDAPRALLPALSAGVAGAAAEALPLRGDDNLRLAAAAAMALLPWFL